MEVERRARDSAPTRYRPRRPSQSVLYRCVQEHLETWLALAGEGDGDPVPAHVEREFRRYLECGILAHGFARARCGQCGHDFLIAFSCKGRGVCPSCNTRRMVATAAHLTDHVLPRLPVRQWVLAVPKRLRYFLHRDADLQGAALRVFLRVVEQQLRAHSPGAGLAARLGAVAFIHRFGSTLNPHLHFHCVVIDGVFDAAAAGGVLFHAASGLDANTIAAVQECVRRRLLRVFVHRGLLPEDAARAMAQWDHGGGFSVDGSVRIEPSGFERLLILLAQGIFYNTFFLLYLISPKTAHRVAGYFEEEAIYSYTEYLAGVDNGTHPNVPAPRIAIDYCKLAADARLRDVIVSARSDEVHHRDVNHRFADELA